MENNNILEKKLPPTTEKNIKALIKYFIFNKGIKKAIESSKNGHIIFYKDIPKCILINSQKIEELKDFYLYEKIIYYINKEKENEIQTPVNNKIIDYDDFYINNIYDKIIQNLYNEYINKSINNNRSNKFQSEKLIHLEKGMIQNEYYLIKYPINFEIIDENIFNILINKENEVLNESNDIIINNQKIIIKVNKYISDINNYMILIGNLSNENKYNNYFISEILILFSNEINRNQFFDSINKIDYINAIKEDNNKNNIKNIHLFENNDYKIKNELNAIINDINNYVHNNDFIENNKMMKLFIMFYLYYEELKISINKEIKENLSHVYYIINKDWMKQYKDYYNYNYISGVLKTNSTIKDLLYKNKREIMESIKYKKYSKYIYEIIKLFQNDFLEKLKEKRKNQNELFQILEENKTNFALLNSEKLITPSDYILNYYDNNEIIDNDLSSLFMEIESNKIVNSTKITNIECLIGEKKIFIINNSNIYPFVSICHLKDNIFLTDFIIYYYDKTNFNSFIQDIELNSFSKFMSKYKNFTDPRLYDILNKNMQRIGRINKIQEKEAKNNFLDNYFGSGNNVVYPTIDKKAYKFIKLYFYYQEIINEVNSPIKNKKERLQLKTGYLVKNDFIIENQKLKDYKILEKYISNNYNIKEIFNEYKNKNEENLLQKLSYEFNLNTINDININQTGDYKYSNDYTAELLNMKINKSNILYYINNFIPLNEDIYKSFKSYMRFLTLFTDNYSYFLGDKRLFLIIDKYNQNSLEICKYNDKNGFEIEFIFNYDNKDERTKGVNYILENGFNDFLNLFLFDNDYSSPIFDEKQNKVGYAYKFNPQIEYYGDLNINFEIKKIFLLYLYYRKLNNKKNFKNNNDINININNLFKEYYIVNEKWIEKYKEYYLYYKICKELDKNSIIQNIFNNLNEDNISDKKLTFIIKRLPKEIINDFNLQDKNANFNYKNDINKAPNLEFINYIDKFQNEKELFYYNDFEIISIELYNSLFSSLNVNINVISEGNRNSFNIIKNQEEKAECIFDKDKIIVKYIERSENKPILEIGSLNNNIFNPEYLLIYDNINDFNNHIKDVLCNYGLNNFFQYLNNNSDNSQKTIDKNNNIIAIVVKIIPNDNVNNFNNNIIMNGKQNSGANQNINLNQQVNNLNYNTGNNNINSNKQINNNHLNEINILFRESILNKFPFPPKVGLQNIGSTCYMNATLQCFCQIEEFASYFKYNNYINNVIYNYEKYNKDCLTSSFKILIDKIWPDEAMNFESSNRYYEPKEFKVKISKMDPLFKSYSAKDAKDLVNFIIMTLHSELNQTMIENNFSSSNNNRIIDQRNQLESFTFFYENYNKTFCSKISELFYSIQQTQSTCLNCKTVQYNYQTYFFIVFPLEKVKEFTINNLQQQLFFNGNNMNMINMNELNQKMINLNNNIVNIIDCFLYNQKIDTFTGNNAMYCNYCSQMSNANYQNTLVTIPKILILLLNRGKGIEFKIKLEFTQYLNLNSFIGLNNVNYNYKLIGVITHLGNSGEDGHFIANCLSPIDNQWYKYNDAIVSHIDDFQKEIIDLGMPYLLFYQKINN